MKWFLRASVVAVVLISAAGAASGYDYLADIERARAARAPLYDDDHYEACMLSRAGEAKIPAALIAIKAACQHQATPTRCRNVEGYRFQQECADYCAAAGYWSRNFGECSKD